MISPTAPIEWLSEAAQVVNALAVLVLVCVTAYYAWTTGKILDESKKMRKAAEEQATSAAMQATAASAQAVSAAAQASAAHATLQHLRAQVEELSGLGKSIVRTTIDSVVQEIAQWEKLDIRNNFGIAYTFPSPSGLVPIDAQIATEHARRVSEQCVALLVSAFDDLRAAQKEIEILKRGSENPTRQLVPLNPIKYDPDRFLTSAFTKLQEARKFVT